MKGRLRRIADRLQYHADLEEHTCESTLPIGACLKCDLDAVLQECALEQTVGFVPLNTKEETMRPKLIGLTGYKGSGKDETASAITGAAGPYKRYALAGPVKEICEIAFGLTWEEMEGNRELKEQILERYPQESPRRLMQQVGTDLFRSLWPDIWIEAMKRNVLANPDTSYVVTDVRFPNEAEAIKELGGYMIRVTRPALPMTGDNHPSERFIGQLDVDYEITAVEGDIRKQQNQIRIICGLLTIDELEKDCE